MKLDTYRDGPGPVLDCPSAGWYGGRCRSGGRCLDSDCGLCHWERVRSALQGCPVSWWVRDVCVSSCTHVGAWLFLSFRLLFLSSSPSHSRVTVSAASLPGASASCPEGSQCDPAPRRVRQPLAHVTRGCHDAARKARQSSSGWTHRFHPARPVLGSCTTRPFHPSLWQKQQKNASPCRKDVKHFIQHPSRIYITF